jgi:hypothetical protein
MIFALLAVVLSIASAARSADDALDDKIERINERARDARKAEDFEVVEQKRRERWELVAKHIDSGQLSNSLWAKSYKAIQAVDGAEYTNVMDLDSVGLVNQLKYREACALLRTTLKEITAVGEGPFLGELAVRYFEVAQQAKGVYRDALEKGSPNFVASEQELVEALDLAIKRDPCCMVALPMKLFLSRPDPKEAFLRAEVRESFRERQKQLLTLAHPVVAADSKPSSPTAANADTAVMPWHAVVEFDKAESLKWLLKDLEYARVLTPEFIQMKTVTLKNGTAEEKREIPNYVVPGMTFAGSDALWQPFRLLYGRLLLGRRLDEQGRRRSAAYFLRPPTRAAKPSHAWDHRYVDLLWRVPTEEELRKNLGLLEKHNMVSIYAPRREFTLGDHKFRIYDFPIADTEKLIQNAAQIFCARSVDSFTKLKFAALNNHSDSVSKLETPEDRQDDTPFSTTPLVKWKLATIEKANDPVGHPLIDLMQDASYNPLVVISERNAKDKAVSEPVLFPAEAGEPSPYLLLDDGTKLRIAVNGRAESPCCWIEFDGATAFLPLNVQAVPKGLLYGSLFGKAFMGLLTDAGYNERDAEEEIRRAMISGRNYLPAKFRELLNARVAALKRQDPKQYGTLGDSYIMMIVAKTMLAEKGWSGPLSLQESLNRLFSQYGFRYLRDRRGNWIISKGLIENTRSATAASQKAAAGAVTTLDGYPYAYLAQDSKHRIEQSQIYSWDDYKALKRSIYVEHLSKMLDFHPCFPAMDVVKDDANSPFVHPSRMTPAYLKDWVATGAGTPEAEADSSRGQLKTKDFVTAPIAPWMVYGDDTQQKTLNHLLLAYRARLLQAADSTRNLSSFAESLRFVKAAAVFAETQEERDKVKSINDNVRNGYRSEYKKHLEMMQPLWEVQLESARNFAKRRYLHKAIVYYNDFLHQLYPSDEDSARSSLFTDVPTTEKAQAFAEDLENLIEGQQLLLNTQVELAGVLNASGLKPSALFIWQRTIDDYDYFLEPAIGIAEKMLESYGINSRGLAAKARGRLEQLVDECRAAIEAYKLTIDWRDSRLMGRDADQEEMIATKVDDILKGLAQDNEGQLDDKQRAEVDQKFDALMSGNDLSFRGWLKLKKGLLEARPALAYRSASGTPAWLACPNAYDKVDGFISNELAVLRGVSFDTVADWFKTPLPKANDEPIAASASFLVGWYWADMNKLPYARAAFMNVANSERAKAKAAGNTQTGLVHEINAYNALLSAAGVVESLPGLNGFKTDFSMLLDAQVGDWEKRWFAAGQYGPHASEQKADLLYRALLVKTDVARSSKAWRSDRYFFADYTFEYGPIPDYLVQLLYETPQLFRPLTVEEVAAKGKDAVEGSKWSLITRDQAAAFFGSRKVDGELKREIVRLAK